MSLLFALIFTSLLLIAVRGWRLAGDPGVAGDLMAETVDDRRERTSLVGMLLRFLDRAIGGRAVRGASSRSRRSVQRALYRAGQAEKVSYDDVIARQATWAFLGGIVAILGLVNGIVFGLPLPILGWYFPRLTLWLNGRRRGALIDKELPDFLDVLAVTISAGLGFRTALARVAVMVGGAVGEEMLIALRQIELGTPRREAFAQLRERSASPAMIEFVTAYLQAEELGAPVGQFLTTYATELRRAAGQKARKAAAQANPKISLALTLVIMPAIAAMMIGAIAISTLKG
ncbi:type II secretion system F family protein [Nocardioides conyzicola]|uniref:Type II secretion system protein GspF domain-containing protein n=1 Tax=Nocardioides conyzicola TaxID=1651781 RepID=A0ABP8XAB1_9ACTN